jgi:hypothetical protein
MPTDFHDWSDFGISNGILYDFDGKTSSNETISHINLQTGATAATYNSASLGFVPRQVAIDWTEKIYNTGTAATASTGTIVPYGNGAITTAQQYNIIKGGIATSGSWGDAAEAFKPKADFGDAPASFDPDPLAPAMHELSSTLKLGTNEDVEWNKEAVPGANADVDGSDEDGLPFVPIFNPIAGNYLAQVSVFNNTGSPAFLCAWLDYNGNGLFDAGEGKIQTINSSTTAQSAYLYWPTISSSLANGSFTYLRIRITTGSMTTSSATGYFGDGEVEDYKVTVNQYPLSLKLETFNAEKLSNREARLSWNVSNEIAYTTYELQKSSDSKNWNQIYVNKTIQAKDFSSFQYIDRLLEGNNFYRLKITGSDGVITYSSIKNISLQNEVMLNITPNPASSFVTVALNSTKNASGKLQIINMAGEISYEQQITVTSGKNTFSLPQVSNLAVGMYQVNIILDNAFYSKKLLIKKH